MGNGNNCRGCWTLPLISVELKCLEVISAGICIYIYDVFLAGSAAVTRCNGVIHSVGQGEVRKKH